MRRKGGYDSRILYKSPFMIGGAIENVSIPGLYTRPVMVNGGLDLVRRSAGPKNEILRKSDFHLAM
jgi:hypothetical protein